MLSPVFPIQRFAFSGINYCFTFFFLFIVHLASDLHIISHSFIFQHTSPLNMTLIISGSLSIFIFFGKILRLPPVVLKLGLVTLQDIPVILTLHLIIILGIPFSFFLLKHGDENGDGTAVLQPEATSMSTKANISNRAK